MDEAECDIKKITLSKEACFPPTLKAEASDTSQIWKIPETVRLKLDLSFLLQTFDFYNALLTLQWLTIFSWITF